MVTLPRLCFLKISSHLELRAIKLWMKRYDVWKCFKHCRRGRSGWAEGDRTTDRGWRHWVMGTWEFIILCLFLLLSTFSPIRSIFINPGSVTSSVASGDSPFLDLEGLYLKNRPSHVREAVSVSSTWWVCCNARSHGPSNRSKAVGITMRP